MYYFKKFINFFTNTENIFNYPKTIISEFNSKKKNTVISFSSIGRGRKYEQEFEFFKLTKKFNVVFVLDITRSWFNNLDLNLIKKSANKAVYSIGFSMGGFNAIMFSKFHKIKKVIAFSPQFSIHPNITKDKTYSNFAARIKNWKYKKLLFSNNTEYLLVFGDTEKEKYNLSLIPQKKNIKIIVIKNCDHMTAPRLHKKNELYNLIYKHFNS